MTIKGILFRVLGSERFVRIFGRPCTSSNCSKGLACAFGDPADCPYQNILKIRTARICPYLKGDLCRSPFPCMREGICTKD